MATIELTKDNFEDVVTRSDLVIIDFWAPWCGPPREKPAQHVENDFGEAMQRVKVHAIERDVHDSREESFDENRAPDELPHETADGAVLAERDERSEVAIHVRLQSPSLEPPPKVANEMRCLLVRGLRPRGHAVPMPGPRTACAVAHREYVRIARRLQRLVHNQLVLTIALETVELMQ